LELTGLTLTQVLGVLGGAGAAVVVLYLLKLRRRRVAVPFVKLWETVLAEKQTTRLLSQLKRWLSLLVALAVVALLAFALGDPRYAGATEDGRTLVALVDASASMQATDVEPSRFEEAKREVRDLIDGMGPADRMLIAQMDASTRPVSPLSDDRRVLRNALTRVEATDMEASGRTGLRLALDVLRGEPNAEVVLLTDGGIGPVEALEQRLEQAGVRLSWVRLGDSKQNVGISAFSVRRYPLDKSQSEVLVELWNPSEQSRKVELKLLGDGAPVDVQQLEVGPGQRSRRFFQNISGVDTTLEAQIRPVDGKPDVLDVDDQAYARLPQRRRARVLAVTSGNLYLQAALLLDEYLDVTEIGPEQYPAEGRYDVVIFDDWIPPKLPETPALYIHPDPPEGKRGPFEVRGTAERPFFDTIDRDHPLVRWTALRDVNVAKALEVKLQKGDDVVAGDQGVPLIVTGTRDGVPIVGLTFDVRKSDLPLRVAWPVFLLNTIDWFAEEEQDGYLSSYRTGETWHIPVSSDAKQARIETPDGTRREVPVVEGRAVYSGSETGLYKLETAGQQRVFAANLGPVQESKVAPVEQLELAGTKAASVTEGRAGLRREVWLYLVVAVLAILMLEWLSYHRRWTV
jgi:hypothetical protein